MIYSYNHPLKQYNAFRTEANAKIFCEPATIGELRDAILAHPNEKKLVIGKGCNMFFTQDFDGLVIKPNLKGMREMPDEERGQMFIEVMASEDWDDFVAYCVGKGYAGLENLSLIPGSVGAAPVQNIGAYGAELRDCLQEVVALDIDTGESFSFSNAECRFGYRDSIFKRQRNFVIVSVLFRLKKSFRYVEKYADLNCELAEIEQPTLQQVREAVIRVRKRKLPDHETLPNCGSFFKNPYITSQKSRRAEKPASGLATVPCRTGLAENIGRLSYRQSRISWCTRRRGGNVSQSGTYHRKLRHSARERYCSLYAKNTARGNRAVWHRTGAGSVDFLIAERLQTKKRIYHYHTYNNNNDIKLWHHSS